VAQTPITPLRFSQGSPSDNQEAAIFHCGLTTIAFLNVRAHRVCTRQLLADEALKFAMAEELPCVINNILILNEATSQAGI
jgi:hypothetical protein